MAEDKEPLRVEGGYLNRPYPINSMADVHRARVLPPPRPEGRMSQPPKPLKAKSASSREINAGEQPRDAGGYLKLRHKLQRDLNGGRSTSGKR